MIDFQRLLRTGLYASILWSGASMASAGDGNQIYILQQSPLGLYGGNTLNVDQSGATASIVAGDLGAGSSAAPAVQDGIGNSGRIDISGIGGQVAFVQSGIGNDASVSLSSALGMASLQQDGNANAASLTVDPLGLSGAVLQVGNGNQADLSVGAGAKGTLVQKGDNNQFGFAVSGVGTTASYTAIGNNLTPVGTGPVVISNGASVTITQTQMQ